MNYQSFSIKNGIIFVIDISCIELSGNLNCSLRKIFEILREKISYSCLRNNNSEEICILLVNTLNFSEYAKKIVSTYTFVSIESVSANMIKKIDNILCNQNFMNSILHETYSSDIISLKELFFKCNKLLNFYKSYKNKSIIFITQNYKCFENINRKTFINLQVDMKDMAKNGINTNIIVVNENSITNTSFWNKIGIKVDICYNLDNLLLILNEKCCMTKYHYNISLYLTKNININVDLYNIVDVKENPKGFNIDAITNNLIKCEQIYKFNEEDEIFKNYTNFLNNDKYKNENILMKMTFYGETFDFTEEEINNIRKISPLGIQILGFRKMIEFDFNYTFSTTKFLSINRKNFKDKRIFYNLYNSCLRKNVFIVGRYVLREKCIPQLIALIPSDNLKKLHHKNEGFYLIKMPFRENIRKIFEMDNINNITNTNIETNYFIDRLLSNFTPFNYEDPMLTRHYQGVEALALEQNTTEMKESFNSLQQYFVNRNLIDDDRINIINQNNL